MANLALFLCRRGEFDDQLTRVPDIDESALEENTEDKLHLPRCIRLGDLSEG
jgi:hypothetical protein